MNTPRPSLPSPLVTSDPRRLGGTPCFTGTRVPVVTLFDHLEAGDTLEIFLTDFPSVSREHALAVLRAAREATLRDAAQPQQAAE
jgi:uncharacterized protein (DUF433 family)